MNRIFEVEGKQIEQLNPLQLTKLLKSLLLLEANANQIPSSSITISEKIEVKDGGEDGRIEWTGGKERTNWLPNRLCMFQSVVSDLKARKNAAQKIFRNIA